MNESSDILETVQRYFDGVHRGDTAALREVFHPGAILVGEVRGETLFRPLDTYLEVVAQRRSPASLGEPLRAGVIGVEVQGTIALVRARFALLGFNYIDHLSLARIDGRWRIVAKTYTHVEPPTPAG